MSTGCKGQHFLTLVSDREQMTIGLLRLEIDPKKMPLEKSVRLKFKSLFAFKNITTNNRLYQANETHHDDISSQFYILIHVSPKQEHKPYQSSKQHHKSVSWRPWLMNFPIYRLRMPLSEQKSFDKHPLDIFIRKSWQPSTINTYHRCIHYCQLCQHYHASHIKVIRHKLSIFMKSIVRWTPTIWDVLQKHQLLIKCSSGTELVYQLYSILQRGLILRPDAFREFTLLEKCSVMEFNGGECFSKSFNYTGFDAQNPTACLFFVEFALGQTSKRLQADYDILEKNFTKWLTFDLGNRSENTKKCAHNQWIDQFLRVHSSNHRHLMLLYYMMICCL